MLKKSMIVSLALGLLAAAPLPALAQTTGSVSKAQATSSDTFTPDEIVAAGHGFFGKASRDFARAVETVFEKQGQPTAYIVGEEMAGSFVGGLRYGEGTVYYKTGEKQRIYWQGPSVGFDFGGNVRDDSDVGAVVREFQTGRPSDPRSTAGDNGDLACKAAHDWPPRSALGLGSGNRLRSSIATPNTLRKLLTIW